METNEVVTTPKYNQKQLEILLFRAKHNLLNRKETVFIGHLILSMKTIFSTKVPTAGITADLDLYINPNFISNLTQDQLIGLLAHETLHPAYMHFDRIGNSRDAMVWNLAGDVVINRYLLENGVTLPDNHYDNKEVPQGASTEEAYEVIIKNNPFKKKQNGQGGSGSGKGDKDGGGNGSLEDLLDILSGETDENGNLKKGMSKDITDEQKNKILDAIVNAERRTQEVAGNIPACVKAGLENIRNPIVDWRVILRRYLNSINKKDYTWKRPNRRFLSQDMYMPTMRGRELENITLAIDTSGSVSQEMLEQFAGDIRGIYQRFNPETLKVIQFDTRIIKDIDVKKVADVNKMEFYGGGGTCVRSTLEAFKTIRSKALIVITDGYFDIDASMNPKKDVIWLIYGNKGCTMPFGKVVHITM